MKVVVTGGGGFIGRFVCALLVRYGHEVTVFDNFSRFPLSYLKEISNKIKIVSGDVCSAEDVEKTLQGCECVFHLAAKSRVSLSPEEAKSCFQTNVIGTYNVLEACRKTGAKCIFASSWMVYGRTNEERVTEDHSLNPVSPYGVSKLTGEHCCKLFHDLYGLRTTVLRLSNVYGLGDKERIVPLFFSLAKRNIPIHVFGREQTINFIYASDVARAFYLAALNDNADGDVYNIGTDKSTNLTDLAKLIVELCGSRSKVIIDEPRPVDIQFYQPYTAKARNKLGFEAKISFFSGLSECAPFYVEKNRLNL